MKKLTPQEALIYIMVVTSAADSSLSDNELSSITDIVSHYPTFNGFDMTRLDELAAECYVHLEKSDGLEQILKICYAALSEKLRNTAYAFAVEVAAADLEVEQEELQFLQMLRESWNLDDLTVAAIERSARIRFRRIQP